MCQKIKESFRHPVVGMPATRGTPLAAEARYYHSFFLAESSVSFDEFLAALSRELSSQFPGVTLNSNWIRACDQRGLIASAQRDVSLLRASIEHQREFSVGVWELLWKITGTYIGKLGLTYAELKTSESELQALAQRYLAAECRKRPRARHPAAVLLPRCRAADVRYRRRYIAWRADIFGGIRSGVADAARGNRSLSGLQTSRGGKLPVLLIGGMVFRGAQPHRSAALCRARPHETRTDP